MKNLSPDFAGVPTRKKGTQGRGEASTRLRRQIRVVARLVLPDGPRDRCRTVARHMSRKGNYSLRSRRVSKLCKSSGAVAPGRRRWSNIGRSSPHVAANFVDVFARFDPKCPMLANADFFHFSTTSSTRAILSFFLFFDQLLATFVEFVQLRAQIGLRSARLGRIRPNLDQGWDQHWPMFAKFCRCLPTSAKFGRTQAKSRSPEQLFNNFGATLENFPGRLEMVIVLRLLQAARCPARARRCGWAGARTRSAPESAALLDPPRRRHARSGEHHDDGLSI